MHSLTCSSPPWADLARQAVRFALLTDPGLISFRGGAGAGRQAGLAGTRLSVWQIINTLRASGNSVDEAASYLDLTPTQVRAAVGYYAEFHEEIDADAAEEIATAQHRTLLTNNVRHFIPLVTRWA